MALNAKQKLFVQAYLVERSGVKAAIAAGYTKNRRVASVQATRLLADVNVRAAVDKALAAQAERLQIKADTVIKDIALIAHDPYGNQFARLKALELLGKHFKLFTEVHENKGASDVQVILTMPDNGRRDQK